MFDQNTPSYLREILDNNRADMQMVSDPESGVPVIEGLENEEEESNPELFQQLLNQQG